VTSDKLFHVMTISVYLINSALYYEFDPRPQLVAKAANGDVWPTE